MFPHEEVGSMFLRNVGKHLTNSTDAPFSSDIQQFNKIMKINDVLRVLVTSARLVSLNHLSYLVCRQSPESVM
jgi:hypothetical protein